MNPGDNDTVNLLHKKFNYEFRERKKPETNQGPLFKKRRCTETISKGPKGNAETKPTSPPSIIVERKTRCVVDIRKPIWWSKKMEEGSAPELIPNHSVEPSTSSSAIPKHSVVPIPSSSSSTENEKIDETAVKENTVECDSSVRKRPLRNATKAMNIPFRRSPRILNRNDETYTPYKKYEGFCSLPTNKRKCYKKNAVQTVVEPERNNDNSPNDSNSVSPKEESTLTNTIEVSNESGIVSDIAESEQNEIPTNATAKQNLPEISTNGNEEQEIEEMDIDNGQASIGEVIDADSNMSVQSVASEGTDIFYNDASFDFAANGSKSVPVNPFYSFGNCSSYKSREPRIQRHQRCETIVRAECQENGGQESKQNDFDEQQSNGQARSSIKEVLRSSNNSNEPTYQQSGSSCTNNNEPHNNGGQESNQKGRQENGGQESNQIGRQENGGQKSNQNGRQENDDQQSKQTNRQENGGQKPNQNGCQENSDQQSKQTNRQENGGQKPNQNGCQENSDQQSKQKFFDQQQSNDQAGSPIDDVLRSSNNSNEPTLPQPGSSCTNNNVPHTSTNLFRPYEELRYQLSSTINYINGIPVVQVNNTTGPLQNTMIDFAGAGQLHVTPSQDVFYINSSIDNVQSAISNFSRSSMQGIASSLLPSNLLRSRNQRGADLNDDHLPQSDQETNNEDSDNEGTRSAADSRDIPYFEESRNEAHEFVQFQSLRDTLSESLNYNSFSNYNDHTYPNVIPPMPFARMNGEPRYPYPHRPNYSQYENRANLHEIMTAFAEVQEIINRLIAWERRFKHLFRP